MLFRRSNLRCYEIASGEMQERPRNDMAIKIRRAERRILL